MKKPVLFSLFSGVGLLDLGFEKTGFSIAYVNEIYPPFLEAYKYSRKKLSINEPFFGYYLGSSEELIKGKARMRLREMIHEVRKENHLVGIIGGPPCPDFSIGGKNIGRIGDKGRLNLTYFQIIRQQKPDFFLFENVKGLITTKQHLAFYQDLKLFAQSCGYILFDRLINSIEYKTPQDRERIILLGFKKEILSDLKIFERNESKVIPENVFPWLKYAKYPGRAAFDFSWPKTEKFRENSDLLSPNGIPLELTVEYWFRKNDVSNHPNTEHCFMPKAGLTRFLTVDEGDDSKKSFKRLHRWRYSPTAAYGNNEVHLHPYRPRRISASEALAIQSMPKRFALPPDMSLSNMFKAIGNGVPFLAARILAKSILKFLNY